MNSLAIVIFCTQLSPSPVAKSPKELLTEGKFGEAKICASRTLKQDGSDLDALEVLTRVHLLENNPKDAILTLASSKHLVNENKTLAHLRATAEYRLGNYPSAAQFFRLGGESERAIQLESFGPSRPYQIDGKPKWPTVIQFIQTHPLPLLELSVNGKKGNFVLDTGANEIILDPAFADSVSVKIVAQREGTFATGKASMVGLGKANSLGLGALQLRSIPVNILPTAKFSVIANGRPVHGVLGLGVLRQFVSTINYKDGTLALAPSGDKAKSGQFEVPMWLAGDHIALVEGEAKGTRGLFFVDTGLAGMAFAPTLAFAKACGIQLSADQIEGVGGAGKVRVSPFQCPELKVGNLERSGLMGVTGAFPPRLENAHGCRIAAIISHQFFIGTSITFDFERMRLGISKDPK